MAVNPLLGRSKIVPPSRSSHQDEGWKRSRELLQLPFHPRTYSHRGGGGFNYSFSFLCNWQQSNLGSVQSLSGTQEFLAFDHLLRNWTSPCTGKWSATEWVFRGYSCILQLFSTYLVLQPHCCEGEQAQNETCWPLQCLLAWCSTAAWSPAYSRVKKKRETRKHSHQIPLAGWQVSHF